VLTLKRLVESLKTIAAVFKIGAGKPTLNAERGSVSFCYAYRNVAVPSRSTLRNTLRNTRFVWQRSRNFGSRTAFQTFRQFLSSHVLAVKYV
jgi:hypothetical protein